MKELCARLEIKINLMLISGEFFIYLERASIKESMKLIQFVELILFELLNLSSESVNKTLNIKANSKYNKINF